MVKDVPMCFKFVERGEGRLNVMRDAHLEKVLCVVKDAQTW